MNWYKNNKIEWKEIIDELDYKNITQKLLYESVSYEDAINGGIGLVVNSGLF